MSLTSSFLVCGALALGTAWVCTEGPFETLTTPQPVDSGRPALLEGWESVACAACHAEITREWASTTHALAWTDPRYQEALSDMKRPEACHGCHIPQPLHTASPDGVPPQKPAARSTDLHHGVSCATCHEGPGGVILGPRGGATDAHATKQDPSFLAEGADRLCISCHATSVGPVLGIAKDFVDTKQRAKGLSCVGCHMQPLERPVAAEAGKPAYPARATRSHALQSPRDPSFLARALAIHPSQEPDGRLRVALVNQTGHRVPGLVGRELTVTVKALGAKDEVLASEVMVIDRSSAVPAEGSAVVELAAQAGAKRLEVVVEYLGPELEEGVVVKREVMALP